MNKINKQ